MSRWENANIVISAIKPHVSPDAAREAVIKVDDIIKEAENFH